MPTNNNSWYTIHLDNFSTYVATDEETTRAMERMERLAQHLRQTSVTSGSANSTLAETPVRPTKLVTPLSGECPICGGAAVWLRQYNKESDIKYCPSCEYIDNHATLFSLWNKICVVALEKNSGANTAVPMQCDCGIAFGRAYPDTIYECYCGKKLYCTGKSFKKEHFMGVIHICQNCSLPFVFGENTSASCPYCNTLGIQSNAKYYDYCVKRDNIMAAKKKTAQTNNPDVLKQKHANAVFYADLVKTKARLMKMMGDVQNCSGFFHMDEENENTYIRDFISTTKRCVDGWRHMEEYLKQYMDRQ